MKKKNTEQDEALDAFSRDFIVQKKANGASAQELTVSSEALIK